MQVFIGRMVHIVLVQVFAYNVSIFVGVNMCVMYNYGNADSFNHWKKKKQLSFFDINKYRYDMALIKR